MTTQLTTPGTFAARLFEEAARDLGHSQTYAPYDADDNLEALLMHKALQKTIEWGQTIKSSQMLIVAEVSRKQMWLSMPPNEDYPDGYSNLNDFLTDAGFSGSTKSYLMATGEKIIPFCDEHNIKVGGMEIDAFLTNSFFPKYKYAIKALKDEIAKGSVRGVKGVLKNVKNYKSREAIGLEYHEPRKQREGNGTTARLPDGRAVVIMVLDSEDSVDDIIRRVAGVVEWGLPAQAEVKKGRITAEIYDS
jgi:hypothetical protein